MYIRKTLLVLILSFMPFILAAQDFWQEAYTGNFEPPTLKVSSNGVVYTISDTFLVSSADNGVTWESIYQFVNIGSPAFGTSPTGVIYLSSDSIRKSTDEGVTWIPVSSPYFGPFHWFIEANYEGDIFTETGILAGSHSYRSENEGATWIKIGVAESFLSSISFHPSGLTYAIYQGNLPPGSKSLFKSTNKGNNWTEITTSPAQLKSIYCTEDGFLFASAHLTNDFYRSTDEGATWNVVFDQQVNDFIKVDDMPILYIAVQGTGVFRSTDNGDNWVPVENTITLPAISKINMDSSGYLYALNESKIYRSVNPANVIVGIDEPANIINQFSLDQNYPNPFNPATVIKYELNESIFVSLKVYDILGNETAVLVNKEQQAGEHQVTFDASEFSAGVYFYQIKAGSYTQTKKMILAK